MLRRKSLQPVGLDYSFPLLKEACKGADEGLVCGSILQIPMKDASCAGLISWGVIEHDEDGPQRALSEFRRVLQPGGWLFVTVPFDSQAVRTAFELDRRMSEGKRGAQRLEFYQYLFTAQELSNALRSAGFKVHRVEGASRHAAVMFPHLFSRLNHSHPKLHDLLGRLLLPVAIIKRRSFLMLLAVAERAPG